MADKQLHVATPRQLPIVVVMTVAEKCWTLISTSASPLVAQNSVASSTVVAVAAVADAVLTPVAEQTVDLDAADAAVVCCHDADVADLADPELFRAAELTEAAALVAVAVLHLAVAVVADFCHDVVAVDATRVAVLPTPVAEPTLITVVAADRVDCCPDCSLDEADLLSVAAVVAVVHRSDAALTPVVAAAMTDADFRDSVCLTA